MLVSGPGEPQPLGEHVLCTAEQLIPRVYRLLRGPSLSFESLHWGQDPAGAAAAQTTLGCGHYQVFGEAASLGRGAGVGGESRAWLARLCPLWKVTASLCISVASFINWAQRGSERSHDAASTPAARARASPRPCQMRGICCLQII